MRKTAPVSTTTPQPSPRTALGRGVSTLIPGPAASSGEQAAAALAALRTATVHVGVLQAAAVLLNELARTGEDGTTRETAATTAALIEQAMRTAE